MLARKLARCETVTPERIWRHLDIGCGTGLHFEAVQARGYTVIGVDLSSDQL